MSRTRSNGARPARRRSTDPSADAQRTFRPRRLPAARRPSAGKTRRRLFVQIVSGIAAVGLVIGYVVAIFGSGPRAVGQLPFADLHDLAFAPVADSPGRLLAGTHAGVQVSDDGGFTWAASDLTGDAMAIVQRAPGETIYAAGHEILAESANGLEWTTIESDLPGNDIHAMAAAPGQDFLAYVVGQGLFRSADAKLWTKVEGEIPEDITSLAWGSALVPTMLAGTAAKGLWASIDDGKTWQKVDVPALQIAMVRTDGRSAIYLASTRGVFRSGGGWRRVLSRNKIAVVPSPLVPGQVLAVDAKMRLFISSDGGETWGATP